MQVSALIAIFKADFGRFWPVPAVFRPISAVSAVGRICRQLILPNMADTARFWPNQPDSARIEADSA